MDIGIATGGFSSPAAIADVVTPEMRASAGELADRDLDLVVVRGWEDVRAYLRAGGQGAVLAVDEPVGLGAVAIDDLPEALVEIEAGNHEYVDHPTLEVSIPGRTRGRLTEAMVMTREPATISEFAIRYRGREIAEYRADGIVVATPPTSNAYARSAGGPLVDPGMPAAVVVPVAPYRTNPDEWVLSEELEVTVVRDEGAVGLFLDGEPAGELACGDRTTVRPEGRYRSIRVEASQSPLAADGD